MHVDREGLPTPTLAWRKKCSGRGPLLDSLETRTLLSTTIQLPLVNPDFQTLYKPGSTTITATLPDGTATQGFGDNFTVESLASLQPVQIHYSDGTVGSNVDVPGWTTVPIQKRPRPQPAAGVVRDPTAYPGENDNFAAIFFAPNANSLSTQIRQTLVGIPALPNTEYILACDVAEAGRTTLFAGDTLIPAKKVGRTNPAPSGFDEVVKTYMTGPNPPAGDLSVVLGTAGLTESGDFTDVSLEEIYSGATPNPVPTSLPLPFGNVNGVHKVVQLTQADGTIVTLNLSGGSGVAMQNGAEVDLQVTDLGKGASLNLVATQGSGTFDLGNVTATGTLNRLNAPGATLAGTLSATGSIGTLTLSALSGTVSAASVGKVTAGAVSGTIYSAASIDSLKLGAFSGIADAGGDIGSVYASSMPGGTLLSGVNLGTGGATPASPGSALRYAAATIGSIVIAGDVTGASFIGAGVNPVDGAFGNGNDTLAGPSSQIGSLQISGVINPSASVESGAFPLVRVDRMKITDLASVPEIVVP